MMICPVCRGTMRWNNERFACPVCGYDDTPKLKPITNADRIRAMSDEELDELLNSIQGDAYLVGIHERSESRYTPYGKRWLDWLRQECE